MATQNELQFLSKPLYAGDKVTVSLRRGSGEKAEEFDSEVELVAKLAPYRASFLGILPAMPAKDDKKPGVLVKAVWPGSPAAEADFREGDRITKVGDTETPNLAATITALQGLQTEEQVEFKVTRSEQEISLTATLMTQPEQILSESELGIEAGTEAAKPRELKKFKLPQFPQGAKYLSPAGEPIAPGLVLWLAATAAEEQRIAEIWQPICDRDGVVLLIARPSSDAGWQFEDLEYLDQLTRMVRTKFAADPQRSIIAGTGKAGQLAYALGLRRRENFSGVVADNSPLPRTMKVPENSPTAPLSLFTILPKKSAIAPLVKHDVEQLRAAGYPVSIWERATVENEQDPIDPATIDTIARWLAGLRRL